MARSRKKSARENYQPVLVRMPPEMHREVKERADAEDRTMAQTIRRALKMYLNAASG